MKKRTRKLKLYVWQDVLTDYTSGVMFALARSPEQARKIILKGDGVYKPQLERSGVFRDLQAEPQVFTRPVGFAVWGGG